MAQVTARNMESLPKQFVSAMRTLFDIMDDKHTGYVKLTDIENRWRDDRTKGLPRGVIESLQKVASHDGLLTFDRFCTGLKICLLCNQVDKSSVKVNRINDGADTDGNAQITITNQGIHRPPSAPLLDVDVQGQDKNWPIKNSENTSQQRTISMPQLLGRKDVPFQDIRHHGSVTAVNKNDRVFGPPKPPRLEKISTERKDSSRKNNKAEEEPRFENEDIADAKIDFEDVARTVEEPSRGLGDGRPSTETQGQLGVRRTSRRREPRRHTLHNGVDYNLLKRMKQIEQEKDVLLQGLNAVEEAREWYLKQLAEVQEKMRHAGRVGVYVEPWSEAQQERLELLRARVLELNRQLGALAAGWRRGLALHMNLALPAAAPSHASVLRSQNRILAEEINRKNDRISVLEREKSALIREVLGQRNRTKVIDNFA